MGLLDDISMGLGLKERDKDYYDRTAQTMERTQGRDRAQQYRQSKGFGQTGRQGLLSFMGGGSDKSSGGQSQRKSTGLIPTLFGYRDYTDMFDRGGKFASGGRYQGAGGYSMLANLAHALSGQEFGERTPYKMKADVSVKQGGSGAGNIPPSPKTVAQTAAMEDAYPKQDYGYDYPTYEPKPTTAAPAPMSDPYAYLFQGQGQQPSNVPSAMTDAMTSAPQDFMLQMARQSVQSQFPTMPQQEQEMRIQQEYQRLMQSMGY